MHNEISRATVILKQGGLILYPTDTVWGIGCDAANTEAVEKTESEMYPNRKAEFNKPVCVNWVKGAFMFIRANSLCEIGDFDTNIFLYFEQIYICKILLDIDLKGIQVPDAKILH